MNSDTSPDPITITSDQLESVFGDTHYDTSPPPPTPPEYVESLLQQTDKANKYYVSLQSYSNQFIPSSGHSVVRWTNSSLETTQKLIVDSWLVADQKRSQKSVLTNRSMATANTLFSWSSSDAYIQERKRQLKANKNDQKVKNNMTRTDKDTSPSPDKDDESAIKRADDLNKLNITVSNVSITNKLSRIVEKESNRFIHSRIESIRAHHSEQINQQIHERKKKDHELYLRKLKIKEAEYEREIEATLNKEKLGFFGSLFGFNTTSSREFDIQSRTSTDSQTSVATSGNQSTVPKVAKRFSFLPVTSIFGSPGVKSRSNDSLGVKKDKIDSVLNTPPIGVSTTPKVSSDAPPITITSPPISSLSINGNDIPISDTPISSPAGESPEHEDEDEDDEEEFAEFTSTSPITSNTEPPISQITHTSTSRFMTMDDAFPKPSNINGDLLDIFSTTPTKTNPAKSDDTNLVNL
ncbi:uncharacterized protein RJT21DRAFT_124595 [Scheffersomyces amazonensis]|uniref:uncharacterized protein n=1 Tax=Scheffersomyces amazonensis TaxID=1078765 RepID=UPI00315D62A1